MSSLFILSGEELSLPFAEVRALIETYSPKSTVELLGPKNRIAISSIQDESIVQRIVERSAYVKFGGVIVSKSERLLSLTLGIEEEKPLEGKEKTFAVDSFSIPKEKYQELGGVIKQKRMSTLFGKVSLDNPDYLFQAEVLGSGEFILALSKKGRRKKQSWKERRPRARKFFLPSAIYPKLARALVNLSRVKDSEVFLDPFCGTGSLLIESEVMGIQSIGMDLTRWIARGALLNVKGFPDSSILRADSTSKLPLCNNVGGIATDVPYGRASSTKGKSTAEIIDGFLPAASEVLSPSRHCVLMHPSSVKAEDNSFELVERHLLYVHRNLTRAISVFRRK